MGKVRSAILTALLVAAILTLALFATISCDVSDGVKRYNSFISKISLGGDLSGYASTVIYPEGVLSDSDYNYVVSDEEESNAEKREKYLGEYVRKGSVWVNKDKLGDDEGKAFSESVKNDAEIISDRLSQKGYTGYSVSVSDGYAIKLSLPTGFSYAELKSYDLTSRSAALGEISHTVNYVTLCGDLSLRDGSQYESSNSLLSINYNLNDFISSASVSNMAGAHALKIKLTKDGFEKLNAKLTEEGASGTAYLFLGETNLQLTFTRGTALTERNLYFSADKSYSEDYAILIDSVVHGKNVQNVYNNSQESSSSSLIAFTPSYGERAGIWLAVTLAAVIVAAIVYSIVKYKLLGLVNTLMILSYAVGLITAIMLLEIQLTVAGALTAVIGLALLCVSNFYVFEAVRNETATGRTITSSVKLGYKKSLMGIIDAHVLMLIAAVLMTLVGVGELSACGLIFFVGVIASYVLHWFTRFMWYVISSPVRNKFKFCGFAREVEDDE